VEARFSTKVGEERHISGFCDDWSGICTICTVFGESEVLLIKNCLQFLMLNLKFKDLIISVF